MCDEVYCVYICRASTFLMLCVSLTQSWLLWEAVGLGRAERRAGSGCSPPGWMLQDVFATARE